MFLLVSFSVWRWLSHDLYGAASVAILICFQPAHVTCCKLKTLNCCYWKTKPRDFGGTGNKTTRVPLWGQCTLVALARFISKTLKESWTYLWFCFRLVCAFIRAHRCSRTSISALGLKNTERLGQCKALDNIGTGERRAELPIIHEAAHWTAPSWSCH